MGRKIKPFKIEYVYVNSPDNQQRLNQAYDILFDLVWKKLQEEKKKNKKIA